MVPAMADRCGSLTTFDPVIFYMGPFVQFTLSQLRDGRYFVPDAWMHRHPEIVDMVHSSFHYDGKLDGWLQGPVPN